MDYPPLEPVVPAIPDFRRRTPELGDRVRYVMPAGSHWAGEARYAIVVSPVAAEGLAVNLCVFLSNPADFYGVPEFGQLSASTDASTILVGGVELDPTGARGGSWHWPGSRDE